MRFCCLVLILSAVAPAAQAQRRPPAPKGEAQNPKQQKARANFELAQRAFSLGKFEEALGLYKAAYEDLPLPAFLFNIAQCHRNTGNAEQALFFYQRYLSLEPASTIRPMVEGLIAEQQWKLEAAARPAPRPEPKVVDLTPPPAPAPTPAPVVAVSAQRDERPCGDESGSCGAPPALPWSVG